MPESPFTASDLADVLKPFGSSRMLPAAAYTSAQVLAWELDSFFAGGWSCAGRAAELAEPGVASTLAPGGFDPGYAVEFWDRTNRQDWAACESVQRGVASPHFRPGPLAPVEDAVCHFETLVARGYLGMTPSRATQPA